MRATCRICRRHRPVMADDRICFPCSVGITHTCPICQAIIPGSGDAPCYACSQRRRSERQIDEAAATIPIKWMSGMFIAFCRGRIPLDHGLASERIARAAEACRAIAARNPAYGSITTDDVHAAIGAEGARRVAPLIDFMCDVGVLEWDRARLQVLIENDRVVAILTALRDSPHAPLLRRYRDDLASRGRKPITQRSALTAAVALLATLGEAPLADLSQRHLARALRKTPGHRASLQGFLSFVAAQGGPKLTVPKANALDSVAQERQLRADIRAWRKRLKNPRTRAEARALIAALIARIYALPLSRVLSLRTVEVKQVSSSVVLWPDAEAVVVEQPLAGSYLRWMPWYGTWVFPGRHRHQPLSEAAVAYHMKPRTTDCAPEH
jgi:hypothetical protein